MCAGMTLCACVAQPWGQVIIRVIGGISLVRLIRVIRLIRVFRQVGVHKLVRVSGWKEYPVGKSIRLVRVSGW